MCVEEGGISRPKRPTVCNDWLKGSRERREGREGGQRAHLQWCVLHCRSGSAINHRGAKLDRWGRKGEKELKRNGEKRKTSFPSQGGPKTESYCSDAGDASTECICFNQSSINDFEKIHYIKKTKKK